MVAKIKYMRHPKRFIGFFLFLFVLLVYMFTSPKTISFWDSPEFVITNYNLLASHPPGAPFYTILVSALLSFLPNTYAAVFSNFVSAFFGAFIVFMVFLITIKLAESILQKIKTKNVQLISLSSGVLGALTLAFSHSFWTASTEAEVYTLSFALMVSICYAMIIWEQDTSKQSFKWLLLAVFLLGISVGVHIIITTVIIPLSILVLSKYYRLTIVNIILSLLAGCILFLFSYLVLVHGLIKISLKADLVLVNTFNAPVNSGLYVLFIVLLLVFIALHFILSKSRLSHWRHLLLLPMFFIIGMSTYLMPLLRSNNSLISDNVTTINRLSQYIKGEQFGLNKIPLLFGYSYNAPLDKDIQFTDGDPIYAYNKDLKTYEITNEGDFMNVNYAKEFSMFFPRVFDLKNEKGYKDWSVIKGTPITYPVLEKNQVINKPTFKENISFFINYQSYWLYLRYLLWNFVGKQNNNHGLGYIKDGNWLSGFNVIDKYVTGDTTKIASHYKNRKSTTVFYALPLLLGILGLLALRKKPSYLLFTVLLFLMFGIGITIYVNPVPSSILVRERDYIFLGSFIVFSIWVGLSSVLILQVLQRVKVSQLLPKAIIILLFIIGPVQMFAKGLSVQNRSGNTFAYRFGKAYLDACPQNAIVFTNGDNMTFPLWYLQDVEGYRTDVRVINFDQLNIDSHIDRLSLSIRDSKAITFNLDKSVYVNGVDKLLPLQEDTHDAVNINLLTRFLNQNNTRVNWNGRVRHYIPSTKFELTADTSYFSRAYNADSFRAKILPKIQWELPKKFYGLNDIVALNIIANNWNERPICFLNNGKRNHYVGLQDYTIQNGLVDVLVPMKRLQFNDNPKFVNTAMNFEYLTKTVDFSGFHTEQSHSQPESKTYAQQILRRNYYFTAQALLENGQPQKAIQILDRCILLFPDQSIPFKQYAFAIGKLYCRLGKTELGVSICKQAMKNIWEEINWITSFKSPPFATINVRHANILFKMYKNMNGQLLVFTKKPPISESKLSKFEKEFNIWKTKNWPY